MTDTKDTPQNGIPEGPPGPPIPVGPTGAHGYAGEKVFLVNPQDGYLVVRGPWYVMGTVGVLAIGLVAIAKWTVQGLVSGFGNSRKA